MPNYGYYADPNTGRMQYFSDLLTGINPLMANQYANYLTSRQQGGLYQSPAQLTALLGLTPEQMNAIHGAWTAGNYNANPTSQFNARLGVQDVPLQTFGGSPYGGTVSFTPQSSYAGYNPLATTTGYQNISYPQASYQRQYTPRYAPYNPTPRYGTSSQPLGNRTSYGGTNQGVMPGYNYINQINRASRQAYNPQTFAQTPSQNSNPMYGYNYLSQINKTNRNR